jgi:hypothetical protein
LISNGKASILETSFDVLEGRLMATMRKDEDRGQKRRVVAREMIIHGGCWAKTLEAFSGMYVKYRYY